MKTAKGIRVLYMLGVFLSLLLGCAHKQTFMIPPRIDLAAYDTIGVIVFSSNARGDLQGLACQRFLRTIQSSQPGIRILELGDETRVLRSVHRNALNLQAVKAIGKKYQVDAVFTGFLDVSKVKPNVRLSSLLTSMSAEAHVEASLTARLLETRSGATLWTDSASAHETVANVRIASNSPATFHAQDPEDAYGRLVSNLVYGITRDFRVRYERG